jgi:hypothetical protein
MNKGMITVLVSLVALAFSVTPAFAGDIYKVVDKDGNVTFTDQKPAAGAEPMDLPPLSVVETDAPPVAVSNATAGAEAEAAEEDKPLSARELRRLYRDFRIIQPQNEETFWGTANTVVVSWGSTEPVAEGMKVRLYVNGEARDVPPAGSVSLTLNRGEHTIYAELRDAGNRRITTTDTVTFFVKQHSANFGLRSPTALPHNGF